MKSVDPSAGELIGEHADHEESEVARRLDACRAAFERWKGTPFAERAPAFLRAAKALRSDRASLADLATREMGKPIAQAEAEVEKCAVVCEHYAAHGEAMLRPDSVLTEARRSYVRFDPLGVVLAIMPWNFPFWQVFRAAVPALFAGNGVALKHAPNVAGCAFAIEQLFARAGFVEGLVTTFLVDDSQVERILRDPRIAAATLTGSVRAGRAVAAVAGSALKKCVLELGGSDAFIVLGDADVGSVAGSAVTARTQNNGQSCIAAKRFFVEAPVYDAFLSAFVDRMRALRVGDPKERDIDVGPLAREDLHSALHRQVTESVRLGAKIAFGGRPLARKGFFYEPTVLEDVRPGMPAFDEELFGPVAALVRVTDADEAVRLANATEFGLGASVWSGDAQRAESLASRIEAGSVFVNAIVKSDPRLPFGGIKSSGIGRELGVAGIREFTNQKTVWVA